jgi:hypothetical protein
MKNSTPPIRVPDVWHASLPYPRGPNLTRTEKKAAQIDARVKGHIARSREAEKMKLSHLRALRAARDAAGSR